MQARGGMCGFAVWCHRPRSGDMWKAPHRACRARFLYMVLPNHDAGSERRRRGDYQEPYTQRGERANILTEPRERRYYGHSDICNHNVASREVLYFLISSPHAAHGVSDNPRGSAAPSWKVNYILNHSIIPRNSSSLMTGIPRDLAFSSLAGPMFSPASTKDVFLEMEPEFLPPFFSMSSLYSSRE